MFEFDEELSALSEDTVITVLNMPLQVIKNLLLLVRYNNYN